MDMNIVIEAFWDIDYENGIYFRVQDGDHDRKLKSDTSKTGVQRLHGTI